MEIRDEIRALLPYTSGMRESLHRIPEPSGAEWKTQALLLEALLKTHPDELKIIAETGVYAYFRGSKGDKTIAFRCDTDALGIAEETGLPYASEHEGMMHACGHDGHMATALTLALYISQKRPSENVAILFQPCEETTGGALRMIKDGALAGVDALFGLHVHPDVPVGKIATRPGPMMASVDDFDILIQGRSAHGAMPHRGADSALAAAHILLELQSIVSRNIDPLETAVITVGRMQAGTQRNIIAEHARLEVTTRSFSDAVHDTIRERAEDIARSAERAFGVKIAMEQQTYYPSVVNPPELVEALQEALGPDCLTPDRAMIAEDFSYYQREVPACFFYCGVRDAAHAEPLHSARFCFEHAALLYGVEAFARMLHFE